MKSIVAADPSLPFDADTWTDGTNTWKIESREQVREKVQLALDRNMPGVMNWTLHYDAVGELSLHRVAHHYLAFQRGIPDLNLDGRVDSVDAESLADNMGTVPGWTGTNTPARFDTFYLQGNWQQGDRDGNGFVNQDDADWLAQRFVTLGVNLPDRLAFTGTFENFQNESGLLDRWRVVAAGDGSLPETGNYTQHGGGFLDFAGTGVGASKFSNHSITIRNQNSEEAFDSLNTAAREIETDLAVPIDLGQNVERYFSMLVRQNTGPLLPSQLASDERDLSLEFLDSAGNNQFDFSFSGLSEEFSVNHQVDNGGEDVATNGFEPDNTYLLIGKITGSESGANKLEASFFPEGAAVGDFTEASFPWMLTANSSSGYNPIITRLGLTSLYEANYTVSNIQIGAANFFFNASLPGDFNNDGVVDAADYTVWIGSLGSVTNLMADGNGNGIVDSGDYVLWKANFGSVQGSSSNLAALVVPEPCGLLVLIVTLVGCLMHRKNSDLFVNPM